MATTDLFKRLFVISPLEPTPAAPAPGLYHYMRESVAARQSDGARQSEGARHSDGAFTRFHLRVEPDGRGMLLANATAAARLTPPGVVIAKGILDDLSEEQIKQQLKRRFRGATAAEMDADLERIAALIANLVAPGDNYPIINLEDAAVSPYEARLVAPLQADLPLAGPEKLVPLLDALWNAAIPHVTILAPTEPDHDSLVRAVERAEDLGLLAGVRARATDLAQRDLIGRLAMAGADHIDAYYASNDAELHDGYFGNGDHSKLKPVFESIHENEVSPVAEVPLVEGTTIGLAKALPKLRSAGLRNANFYAIAAPDDMPTEQRAGAIRSSAMPQIANMVEELSNEMDVRFIWQPPVLRDPEVTLAEQVRAGPRASDDLSVRVEPGGEVIPARGPYRSAGNLLSDDWSQIWNHEAFLKYRERVERPTRCEVCPGLALCAADCPRKPAGWSDGLGAQQ
jgi:radical SAM protein with 4Fe4S-binding SPASM domain